MPEPELIILDTDLGGDIDDLGALAVLHALRKHGYCELLAVMSVTGQGPAISAIQYVNRYFGCPDIPVGRRREPLIVRNTYADAVTAADLTHIAPDPSESPSAVQLYRRLLSKAQPGSITIATIGPLFFIDELLRSGPDDISPRTGIELISHAVKRLVMMGGHYPASTHRGETNFVAWQQQGVTQRVMHDMPRPVEVVTFEVGDIGSGFATGKRIIELPPNHPVRIGYEYFFQHPPQWAHREPSAIDDWSIWDQITVLQAVMPGSPWLSVDWSMRCEVEVDGSNRWTHAQQPHGRVVNRLSPDELANAVIEPLMLGYLPSRAT